MTFKKCYSCANLKLKRVILRFGDWRFGFYVEHYCKAKKFDVRFREIGNCKHYKEKKQNGRFNIQKIELDKVAKINVKPTSTFKALKEMIGYVLILGCTFATFVEAVRMMFWFCFGYILVFVFPSLWYGFAVVLLSFLSFLYSLKIFYEKLRDLKGK